MHRYSPEIVKQARELAKNGLSYRKIGMLLKITSSSISVWCRDVIEADPRKITKKIQLKREAIKKAENRILEKISFDSNLNKLICAIIYGCEGSKYPSSNCVAITNSDPNLVATFVKLFRKTYLPEERKFSIHLQIHDNQNYKDLVNYWGKLLKVPANQFIKPTITVAGGKKHRMHYLGTCTVKYYDYRFQLKLIGVYEEFMRKFALLEGMPNG